MKLRTVLLLSYLASLCVVTLLLFGAYQQMFLDYNKLKMAMAITISSSVLSLLINSFFIFPMAKAIARLNKQSQAIAKGEYDISVTESRTLELHELGKSLHMMAQEIKEKITALQQEESRRNELIANLSHDIKTPLASIRSYSEALLDGMVHKPDDVRSYLLGIGEQTERVVSFANELFSIAAIDQKNIEISMEILWLDQLLVNTLQTFEAQIVKENRTIEVKISEECVSVYTDKTCMERILYNLIGNAIKFSRPGTTIWLNIYNDRDSTCFEVKDEGTGIPSERLNRIFDRFYRVEESRNQMYGGAGIGLAIARELTELLQGQISATSVYGAGSTFTVRLPNHPDFGKE
ncbi:signal transduction histidine kinase [Paenibacillus yonginensis]|uniref:histidine kinase n=1 Tax=Paenibacillus yonginensis TaxID=1462996 RepID=A0A1B1MX99_9BACL|nr:HAMP domain-containing sensor histidine kinase [Paenibacillus yonginensis]ANS73767.1 signal transduction histidine kinase [Paenibacillus yonginensis]